MACAFLTVPHLDCIHVEVLDSLSFQGVLLGHLRAQWIIRARHNWSRQRNFLVPNLCRFYFQKKIIKIMP